MIAKPMPSSCTRAAISRSASLGLSTPLGWLCTSISPRCAKPGKREHASHVAARHDARGGDGALLVHRRDEAYLMPAREPDRRAHGGRGASDQARRFAGSGHRCAARARHVLSGFRFAAGKSTLFRISR